MKKLLSIAALLLSVSSFGQQQLDTDQIADEAITNAKLADATGWTIKGRNSATDGVPQDIAVGDIVEDVTPVSGEFAIGFDSTGQLTKFDVATLGSGGGVTSVALSGSDGIEIDSGSPITTTGTIALGVDAPALISHLNAATISGSPSSSQIVVWNNPNSIKGDSKLVISSTAQLLMTGTGPEVVMIDSDTLGDDINTQILLIDSGFTLKGNIGFQNTNDLNVNNRYSDGSILFSTNNTEAGSFDSSGDLNITSGDINIAALSLVDGRDPSVDGVKLDGIEALATVDSKQIKVSSNDTTEGYLEDKVDSAGVEGVGIIRSIANEGGNEAVSFRLGDHYLVLASTGLYTGGVLSAGATTGTFDITAGDGFFIDSNTDFSAVKSNLQPVAISARTNESVTNILTQPVTYISINESDAIIQSATFPTPQERREAIFLGVVVHSDNVNVNAVDNLQVTANDIAAQTVDVMEALGFFNLKGNRITANGANLSLNKSAGTAFKRGSNYSINRFDPHTLTLSAQNLLTFRYRNQDSAEGSDVTVLDPTTYDNAGVITTVPSNNNATIQRVYIFPDGGIRIQRGQEVFSNFNEAIAAAGKEAFLVEENIEDNGLPLASIVMKKNANDLTDDGEAQIFDASRFGELFSIGSSATTTLQNAYNNSVDPEILTDATRGALSVRVGSGADTDITLEVENTAASSVFSVDGEGDVISNSLTIAGGAVVSGAHDGNGIYSGSGSTSAVGATTVALQERLIIEESVGGVNMALFHPTGFRIVFKDGSATPNEYRLDLDGMRFTFDSGSDFIIDGDTGSTGQSFHSNGADSAPTYEYPHQSDVQTTAPSGVLGQYYTDDSGAFCWYSGSAWVVVAGAGSCS